MSVLGLFISSALARGRLFGGEKGSTADNPPSAEQPDAGSIPAASTIIPSLWSPALLAAASIAWGLEEEVPDHEPYCWECGRPLDAD